jgi:hypothetical protein
VNDDLDQLLGRLSARGAHPGLDAMSGAVLDRIAAPAPRNANLPVTGALAATLATGVGMASGWSERAFGLRKQALEMELCADTDPVFAVRATAFAAVAAELPPGPYKSAIGRHEMSKHRYYQLGWALCRLSRLGSVRLGIGDQVAVDVSGHVDRYLHRLVIGDRPQLQCHFVPPSMGATTMSRVTITRS